MEGFALAVSVPLVIAEEKRPILAYGPAECAAKLVLPVFRLRKTSGVLKEVGGFQLIIAQELLGGSMQSI